MWVRIEVERLVGLKAVLLGNYPIVIFLILFVIGLLRCHCVRGFPGGEFLELHDVAS